MAVFGVVTPAELKEALTTMSTWLMDNINKVVSGCATHAEVAELGRKVDSLQSSISQLHKQIDFLVNQQQANNTNQYNNRQRPQGPNGYPTVRPNQIGVVPEAEIEVTATIPNRGREYSQTQRTQQQPMQAAPQAIYGRVTDDGSVIEMNDPDRATVIVKPQGNTARVEFNTRCTARYIDLVESKLAPYFDCNLLTKSNPTGIEPYGPVKARNVGGRWVLEEKIKLNII